MMFECVACRVFALIGMYMFMDFIKVYPDDHDVKCYCHDKWNINAKSIFGCNATDVVNLYVPMVGKSAETDRINFCHKYMHEKNFTNSTQCFAYYKDDMKDEIIPCEFLNRGLRDTDFYSDGYWNVNFNFYVEAFFVLFVIVVGNNWHVIKDGYCSKSVYEYYVQGDLNPRFIPPIWLSYTYFYAFWLFSAVLQVSIVFNMIFESFMNELKINESGGGATDTQQILQMRIKEAEDFEQQKLTGSKPKQCLMLKRRARLIEAIAAVRYEDEIKVINDLIDKNLVKNLSTSRKLSGVGDENETEGRKSDGEFENEDDDGVEGERQPVTKRQANRRALGNRCAAPTRSFVKSPLPTLPPFLTM